MRSALRSFAALFLAVAVVTCVDSPVAPSTGVGPSGGRASLAFAPRFAVGAAQAGVVYDLNGLLVNQVHVVVTLNGQTLADTSVAYSATDSSFSLALNVAANPGDEVAFSLQYLSGTTVLYSGSGTATTFAVGGTAPANPTPVVLVAVGPGATAAHVTVTPSAGSFPTTAPIPFGATVTDANNTAIAGALLSWTVSDPTLATIGATTGLLQPTGKRGTVTVSASTLDGVTGTAVIALVPPPAKLVVISGSGQTGAAGAALAQPVIVQVQAADGIGASGQTVAFSLSGGTGTGANAGSVSPATLTTDANGNASATVTLGTTAGTYMLTATSGTFTAPATETATAANVATLTLVSGSGQTDSVKQQLPAPLVVKAADQFGNPKSGVGVTWARTAGSGTPSATSTTTGADGTTSVTYTFGAAVGTETIAASAAGVTTALSFTETATTGGAATITAVLGNGQLAAIEVALGTPLTVRVVDAGGNPVTGAHVTWTITNGTLATSQATTDATGQATATVVTGQTTGPLTVTAALVSGASIQFSETVTSGLATGVKFTGNPSNVTSGAAMTPAVQVTVTDAGGNPVTVASPSVTLTLTGGTVGAVLSGTLTQPTINGVATFSNLSVNLAGSGYALVATVSGLTPVPSATFAVTAAVVGVATQIAQNGGSVTGTVGVAVATPPSVIVKDANNNPVAGVAVTFAVATGGGSITGGAQTTNASGIATVGSWTLGNTVGTNTLTATSAGLTGSPVTITAASVAGAASALFFTVQPGLSAAASPITPAPQVTARDAFGNTATSFVGTISIGLAVNPGGGFLSGTISTSATAGLATFSNLMLSQPGAGYVISASAAGLTGANSAPFTVTAAGPAIIQWTNSAGGSWSAPGNWNLARAPISTDSVVIALSGTYTVILDTTFVGKSIVVGGTTGTQTLSISSRTLTLSGTFAVSNSGSFVMTSSVLAGTGSIVNLGVLTLTNSSFTTAAVNNQGTLVLQGGTAITGTLTTTPGSSLTVEGNASCCAASTVISTGFTNNGSIVLTAINGSNGADNNASLTVTGGTLVNSPSGTININAGTGTAARQLAAQLNNQGTLNVNTPFTLAYPTSAHLNTGTITLNSTMTVTQSGGSPSFNNAGTITVASGQALNVTAGNFFNQTGGTISGPGALSLTSVTTGTFNASITIASLSLTSTVATFATAFSTATTALSTSNSSVSGASLTFSSAASTTIVNTTINNPIDIQGTLIVQGTSVFNGAVTSEVTSVMQVEGNASCCGAALTVANGFTNNGIIQLTAVNGSNGANNNATMTVTSGTLVNAVGASIVALPGTGAAARTLTAQLNNQGTLIVNVPLTLNAVSATYANSGNIDVNAALTLNQSGTSPSFTNSGGLVIGSGQTFTVNNGTFNYAGGSVSALGTLTLNAGTLNLSANLNDANATLSFPNSTINGPDTLINLSSESLTLTSNTVNAPIQNQGTLFVAGTNALNGALTTTASSVIQIEGNAGCCAGVLTVANSFTNNGMLTFTTVNGSNGANNNAALTLTNGTLTNAGTFNILAGTGAGSRTLTAALNNQGTLTVSTPFTINGVNGAHTNSGTINVNATFTVSQSGGAPSFVNTGSVVVASTQQFIVTGGAFTEQTGSTLSGAGGIALSGVTAGPLNLGITIGSLVLSNSTASLPAPNSIATTNVMLSGSTLSGPGIFTNIESGSETIVNSTINAPVDNQGTWHLQGTNAINGSITPEPGSSLLIEGNSACCGSALTVASGFTNAGTLQLTTVTGNNGANNNASLTVTSGVLTNASTGTISIVAGTGGASPGRTLVTQLNNQGTFTVSTPLTYNLVSGTITNSGTVNVSAALTLNESGTSPAFTSSGGITIASGQTFTVNNGAFAYSGGAVTGTGTLALNTVTMVLDANFSNANVVLTVPNTTIIGPDTLANAPGQTLTLSGTAVNTALTNLGTLIASGTSLLNGGLGTSTTSSIQVEGNASCCAGTLVVANSFSNFGALTLTAVNGSNGGDNNATLIVSAGTLTNGPSGSIIVTNGTGAGSRTLTAQLNNQGTLTVNAPLTINGASAAHINSGTITVNANLTVTQSATSSSFTNSGTGTVSVASGQLLTVSGGEFTDASGGSLTGPGGITLSNDTAAFNANLTIGGLGLITSTVATLASGVSTGTTNVVVTNSTLNGPGTLTNGSTGSSTLTSATINAPVHNMGFMSLQGGVAFNAAVTTDPGSTMQIAGNSSFSGANVVVSSGFTNNGLLQVTTINGSNGANNNAVLTLNSGTLTNSSTGTISVLLGTATGTPTRTLTAPLNNQGILNVSTATTINAASAAHSNSGTMNINAVLTLTQSGVSPSFTNSGPMNLAAASGFLVNGGTFTYQGGTISGPGTLAFSNAPVTLTGNLNNANGATIAASGTTTIGGSGVLTNGTTGTLALGGTTVAAALVNQGTIVASGASTMSGGLTTVAGSLLEIAQVDNTAGTAALSITAANGFTNEGTIELSNLYTSATNASLTITGTALITNDTSGLFSVLGGTTLGGTRVLNATMENLGTLNVYQGGAGTFTVNGGLTTSGTLDLTIGGTTQGSTYDLIQVVNNYFTINGGTLSVALVNAFTLSGGQNYTVATSTFETSGSFTTLNLPVGLYLGGGSMNSLILTTNPP